MLIYKEYPATHSMSTAWYMVDDDDNVAILDMNENGPVPWGTPEECIESLVMGYDDESGNENERKTFGIDLTTDQLKLLLSDSYNPMEYQWWFNCIVKIDADKKEEFLSLTRNTDCEEVYCISQELNLYHLSAPDAVINDKGDKWHIRIRSTIKKLLDRKIILKVYETKDFFIDDEYDPETGSVLYDKRWDTCPYYIYAEPYWAELLSKRLNTPDNPVKMSQLPNELASRVIRIPGRFDDREFLQIANYVPCYLSGDEAIIANDCEYGPVPQEDGSKAYVLSDLLPEQVDSPYLGSDTLLCAYPTVLIIDTLSKKGNYEMKTSLDEIFRYSLQVAFRSQKWVEAVVEKFRPYVILLKGGVENELSSIYPIKDNEITIQGTSYPAYLYDDRHKCMEEILDFARKPYRGKEYPFRITMEEMEKLKAEGKALTYSQFISNQSSS